MWTQPGTAAIAESRCAQRARDRSAMCSTAKIAWQRSWAILRPRRPLVHHHPLERHQFPRTLHHRRDRMSPRWSRLFPDGRAQAVLPSLLFWAYSPDSAPYTTASTIKDSSTSQFLLLLLSRCPATLAPDWSRYSVSLSPVSS